MAGELVGRKEWFDCRTEVLDVAFCPYMTIFPGCDGFKQFAFSRTCDVHRLVSYFKPSSRW